MTDISILDLVRVRTGRDARNALDGSRDLAAKAEDWGYTRFWVAEHHNMPGIASAATVRDGLRALRAETGADELMIVSDVFDHDARLRSYELIAQVAEGL